MSEGVHVVGSSIGKRDAIVKARGQAIYPADIKRTGMLYGKIVRSPHAAALIQSVDTRPARAQAGVLAVLTAADIPGANCVGSRGVRDQPVFVESMVNMAGEAIACVVAVSEQVAANAATSVRVGYNPLEPVTDPELALLPESRRLRPEGNLCQQLRIAQGDFGDALRRAALVVKNTYRTPFVDHGSIEPDAAVAEPSGAGVTLYVSSKSPHHDQEEIANVLGLPRDKVHIVVAAVGGSFGGKPDLPHLSITALAALKLQLPVKITLDRDECFIAKTKRHAYRMEYTHAVSGDGEILGVRVDILADAGAYTSYTLTATAKGLIHAAGPYRVQNVDMRMRAVFTNNPVSGAMRGYGVPQVVFAVERQMDIIANRLGMDPIELRIKNAFRSGDRTATGQALQDVHLIQALQEVRRISAADPQPEPASPVRRAWGTAAFFYGVGRTAVEDKANVRMRLEPEGVVHLFVGTPDTGQGSDTALAQIAAEELGLPFELIRVTSGDTDLTQDAGTSTASRVTLVVGNAVQRAAAELKTLLLDVASEVEGKRLDQLPPSRDCLRSLSSYCNERNMVPEAEGQFTTDSSGLDAQGQGAPYEAYTFGVQLTQVAVERETGHVRVERAVCCYDAGTVVNPTMYQAQIEGGTIMAQGYALTEQLVLVGSEPQFPNWHAYLMPTALDASQVEAKAIESYEPSGPFGAKGIGEPAALPGAASIVNAVSRATGCEFFDLPVTPEKIVESAG